MIAFLFPAERGVDRNHGQDEFPCHCCALARRSLSPRSIEYRPDFFEIDCLICPAFCGVLVLEGLHGFLSYDLIKKVPRVCCAVPHPPETPCPLRAPPPRSPSAVTSSSSPPTPSSSRPSSPTSGLMAERQAAVGGFSPGRGLPLFLLCPVRSLNPRAFLLEMDSPQERFGALLTF